MEKQIVSPFEFAIMQAAGVSTDDVRPETAEEKQERIRQKFTAIANNIKIKSFVHRPETKL